MEEAGHRGRRNKKAPVGTTLLLMCMIVPTLAISQPLVKPTCSPEEYSTDKGICCNKCSPGYKLVEKCNAIGHRSKCAPCLPGQFMDQLNFYPNCKSCRICRASKHEHTLTKCVSKQNTICECDSGYYRFHIDSQAYECRKCAQCAPDEKEKQNCTPLKNTVCECKENYYRVKNKCEPCKSCTTECEHYCSGSSMNTKAPDTGKEFLTNIIAGVVSVALLLLGLVALITHLVTKRSIKKKLVKPSHHDDSPDPCELILCSSEECSENSNVETTPNSPVSEQQPSNLPDCVPLEIKITDLIYSVLELVPALQVKQLVRTLGVRDTEIEQAELDHRFCKEAHYQMLRLWAEKVSRADGGGESGLLHLSLLQELLDKLRTMRLGGVAEELETKYSIQ
ncbi:tumor necrosis factor receptor superfamily member 1A [Paralichthys olivaceus]|uniref:tumor necrosis factor receptor superfamily member 1A n=1 Tax=Paralichthys olivaceus TaxID=8255 RepID=UPI00097D5E29|nr:PREDICTED: tumor necrosis factor receptor superfamily member 1A [Paralichthys olivaceus]